MRKTTLTILLLALAAFIGSASAQFQLVPLASFGTNGDGTIRPGDLPFLTGDGSRYQRGMAYNSTTGHLIIVNRFPTDSPTINVIDAFTGAEVGTLDKSAETLGGSSRFIYNMVGVAEDGAIYVGNLSTSGNLVEFILYRWETETSEQVRVYGPANPGNTTAGGSRWGDVLAVRGSGVNTEVLIATQNGTLAAILRPDDASMATFSHTALTTDVPAGAIGYGLAFGAGNTFYGKAASSAGNPLYRLSYDRNAGTATTIHSFSSTEFPGRVASMTTLLSSNWLAAIDMSVGANADLVRLYDISNPANPPAFLDRQVVAVWTNANNIFSGSVAFGSTNVYALNSDNGLVAFTIAEGSSALPPLVFGDPTNRLVQVSSNTVFTVGADGSEPLKYQWQYNGADLADATNASLALTNVAISDAGSYRVVVTNNYGAVTSVVAQLTVEAAAEGLIAYEPFDYAADQPLTTASTIWTPNGSGNDARVASGSLTLAGLSPSMGNCLTNGGAGEAVRYALPVPITTGDIYYSFLMRVDSVGAAFTALNSFIAAFLPNAATSTYEARLMPAPGTTANQYKLGVTKVTATGSGPIWAANEFVEGETVFIVCRYRFNTVANTTDDQVDLWINPSPSDFGAATAPASTLAAPLTGTDITAIGAFTFRQNTAANTPAAMTFDELRIGGTWAAVTPPTPPTPPALSIALDGANVVLSWPTNQSAGYSLQYNLALDDSGGWEPVEEDVVIQGADNTVTVPVSGARFFRLKK